MVAAGSGAKNSSWTEASFLAALKVGFTAFDTAHEYGNQAGVGRALATVPRSSVFVTTKVPGCVVDPGTLNPFECGKETAKIFDDNLKLLNMTYVDLLLVHYPPLPTFILRSCGSNLSGDPNFLLLLFLMENKRIYQSNTFYPPEGRTFSAQKENWT